MGFSTIDYVVLFVYLITTTLLGIVLRKKSQTLSDYFLAGRRLPWWALSLSIVATETSIFTFIGVPAISYGGTMTFLQLGMGYVLGKILVSTILLPSYFKSDIQSAYEILTFRFGGKVKDFSAGLFQINRVLADGVRLFGTALVLSLVTQFDEVWTILLIGLITIIYTFYGGMTAVVWNDVIQLVIYILGATIAFVVLLAKIPSGLSGVIAAAQPASKMQVFDFTFSFQDPYVFWAALIGGASFTFATHGTDQMMVQRYLACRTKRRGQQALIISGFIVLAQFALFLFIGVMLHTYYMHFPLEQPVERAESIFPIFIVQQMPPGISGLVIAAVFAAAMSTLSSSLNSLSSSAVNDFYRPYLSPGRSEKHYVRVSQLCTAGWGIILIAIAIVSRNWGGLVEVGLSIPSVIMGCVLGVFLLGKWTRVHTEMAALLGMTVGLTTVLLVHFNKVYAWGILPNLAWTWYILIGSLSTILVGAFTEKFYACRTSRR